MSMYFSEGREEAFDAGHCCTQPISVRSLNDLPEEPHWVIMTFDDRPDKRNHIIYTAYLDKSTFERSVKEMAGRNFKAFHVDSIARVTIDVKI